jgi:hypothetical protein
VVDVVGVLTESENSTDYLKKLRKRDLELGTYLGTICPQVEMLIDKGRKRKVLASDHEMILRIIQSIPSPKAEPFKRWLAKVGRERLEEMADPEKAIICSQEYWRKMGRSEKWIKRRLGGQEVRNKLTEYWRTHEVDEGKDFALLSNIIHKEWSDLTITEHKQLKNLENQNLRDHMLEVELFFTAFAEMATEQIAESVDATGLEDNKIPAKHGGAIAKHARCELEEKTKKSVISGKNFLKGNNEILDKD